MFQVGVAFKTLRDNDHIPVGFKKSSGWISLGRLGGSRMAIAHRTYMIKRWLSDGEKLAFEADNILFDGFNDENSLMF